MKCENCKQKDAVVFFEQTVNGETRAMHLCRECAAKIQNEGLFAEAFPFGGNLFGALFAPESVQFSGNAQKRCPGCSSTFADIRHAGKVCCPTCYAAFEKELAPTLRSVHGNASHSGRCPRGLRDSRQKKARLSELRTALSAAVAAEEYEKAAALRDEIKSLEKEEG